MHINGFKKHIECESSFPKKFQESCSFFWASHSAQEKAVMEILILLWYTDATLLEFCMINQRCAGKTVYVIIMERFNYA
jgi:hypothetical protein